MPPLQHFSYSYKDARHIRLFYATSIISQLTKLRMMWSETERASRWNEAEKRLQWAYLCRAFFLHNNQIEAVFTSINLIRHSWHSRFWIPNGKLRSADVTFPLSSALKFNYNTTGDEGASAQEGACRCQKNARNSLSHKQNPVPAEAKSATRPPHTHTHTHTHTRTHVQTTDTITRWEHWSKYHFWKRHTSASTCWNETVAPMSSLVHDIRSKQWDFGQMGKSSNNTGLGRILNQKLKLATLLSGVAACLQLCDYPSHFPSSEKKAYQLGVCVFS